MNNRQRVQFPQSEPLRLSKLEKAKRTLGASTATEAIEMALDLAVFQRELIDGTRALFAPATFSWSWRNRKAWSWCASAIFRASADSSRSSS